MKEQISNLKNNPIGMVVGAGVGYLVATKLVKTENLWMKIGISVVGAIAGAMGQAKMKAKKGVPTAPVVSAVGK